MIQLVSVMRPSHSKSISYAQQVDWFSCRTKSVRIVGPIGGMLVGHTPHNAALTISNISPWSLSGFAFGFALSGVYVGEGWPPIPQKLVDKIRHREYVEMSEMPPEFWPLGKGEEKESKRSPARRPKQVTDFHTWLQCFTTYASLQVY